MGVGAEGEPCVVVAQHSRDGFDVYAVLKSQGVLGVPLDKQFHCLLGDGNQLKGVFALCLCCDETGCSGLRSDSVLSENRAKFIRGGSRGSIRLQKTMRDNKRKSFLYFWGESMTTMACLLT